MQAIGLAAPQGSLAEVLLQRPPNYSGGTRPMRRTGYEIGCMFSFPSFFLSCLYLVINYFSVCNSQLQTSPVINYASFVLNIGSTAEIQ
jgi:hypothetical protein